MNPTNDSDRRVVIIGGSQSEVALLRTAMVGWSGVVVASPQIYTSAAAPTVDDQSVRMRQLEESERADWNRAVDVKKAARRLRRGRIARGKE